jgi:hypothetical protein
MHSYIHVHISLHIIRTTGRVNIYKGFTYILCKLCLVTIIRLSTLFYSNAYVSNECFLLYCCTHINIHINRTFSPSELTVLIFYEKKKDNIKEQNP